ncbi:alpha/beta hydrolase [Mumia sp. zg.B21]|uniref:alpha/beta fold hydrolase n=1 Tax=unclassified Mumia TaxID=2621872 RepID=UPI001C6E2A08|nr:MULTISPECIES: alpha/beta hydrolase [unclassified Mumia]MBW9210877.1 alpha/beta hydrolase [Mumia sp. zg.B21]MDD9350617.1 alpha/beta hydrolase [Mumia sp.]
MTGVSTTISRDGTRLAYEVNGEGPPLVYVTGAICHRTFRPVQKGASVLSRSFRVLSYDRRGRGDSTDTAPWSLDREVEDLEALIDTMGGRSFIYGHSSGAVLALHAAHRLAPKVQGVVLYDASWVADQAGADRYATVCAGVEALLDQGRDAAAIKRFLVGIGMPRFFAALLPFMPGWRRLVALAPTLRYDMSLTAAPPPLDVAATVRVPTHVMVGERSPEELHRVADALQASIPGATRETLAGQDHMVSEKVLLPSLVRHLRPGEETARSRDPRPGGSS